MYHMFQISTSVSQATVVVSTTVPTQKEHLSVHVIRALVCHLVDLTVVVSNFSNTSTTSN